LEKTTETFQRITVKPSYGLNHEDLERMIQEGFEKGVEDIEKRLLIEVEVEAKQLLHSLKVAIEADSDLLSNEEKENLESKANYLKSILSQSDREMIRKQIKDLSVMSQSFAERRISRAIQKRLMGQPVI
ncbi:MAG: Fe-S protein assembly chaperone HscA, partial [Alphaproteobacteria bacterium]|nr:Fe-S protein assembly chaperone HscA [Alphaproteobacteria bacterium]